MHGRSHSRSPGRSIMRGDSWELTLSAISLCQLLPCQLGPPRSTVSINLGPVVQSVVSLTSSLRVISLTVSADSMYNIMIFFATKMWVAFAKATHIFSAKNFSIFAYHSIKILTTWLVLNNWALYVKGCLNCTIGSFHMSIPVELSLLQNEVQILNAKPCK